MILSPSAAVTVNLPPLKTVPTGAVVADGMWHRWQPIELKIVWPAVTSDVIGPRGGGLVARMKRAKNSTSGPKGFAGVGGSSGSGTSSNAATDTPFEVFSVGCS